MRPSAMTMESLKMVDYLVVLCAEKSIRQSKRVIIHSFSFLTRLCYQVINIKN